LPPKTDTMFKGRSPAVAKKPSASRETETWNSLSLPAGCAPSTSTNFSRFNTVACRVGPACSILSNTGHPQRPSQQKRHSGDENPPSVSRRVSQCALSHARLHTHKCSRCLLINAMQVRHCDTGRGMRQTRDTGWFYVQKGVQIDVCKSRALGYVTTQLPSCALRLSFELCSAWLLSQLPLLSLSSTTHPQVATGFT
jgi:hypothetical protein